MASVTEPHIQTPEKNGQEVDFYRLFAFVFGAPTRGRFESLRDPALWNTLHQLWQGIGCEGEFPSANTHQDYGDYESTYIAVFDVGAPQPPVPLLESSHQQALPAQQIALENTQFYQVLGLKADVSQYAPDHLVTQLEFLAAVRYARENTSDQENRGNLVRLECDFLDRHLLNWLPAALQKLEREQPPVFPALLKLLLAFLRHQRETLEPRPA
jgi:DMSO reductase family type II enzyme chaperone